MTAEAARPKIRVQVQVLGSVEISVSHRPVSLTGLQRRLISALALHPGSMVTTDRLLFALWGDDYPRSAQNRIQALVSDLRRRVAAAGGSPDLVETVAPGYRLSTVVGKIDIEEFEYLVRSGHQHMQDAQLPEALTAFTSALQLWRGSPFDGVQLHDQDFAAVVGRLGEQRLQAVEERADARLSLGHAPGDLAAELTALVEAHPLRERLRGQLMEALARSGRTAEALEVYRAGHAISVEELGTELGEALQQLHQQILTGTVGLAAGARPVAEEKGPAQLPPRTTPFVGRDDYLRDLDAMTGGPERSAVVISTIEGTGGVGKTALAVEWGHRAIESYPDGQLYLNLHGYSSNSALTPTESLAKLLTGLGVPPASIPWDVDAAAAMFRSRISGRRLLILLDNAANPEQVRPLLPSEPGCLALITSRDRFTGLLASHGAHRLLLDVLSPEEAMILLRRLAGAERVDAEPEAASALTRACSYLPLALRIAAANVVDSPQRSLAELVEELHGPHGLGGLDVAGDPSMSVRSVIAQSYSTLDYQARRALELMSLVPGPDVTVEALADMASRPARPLQPTLDLLVRACLVQVQGGRYALHDVVRRFGSEQAEIFLTAEERRDAVVALARHYSQRIDAAAKLLYPQTLRLALPEGWSGSEGTFADLDTAMAWLEAERRSLVALVRWAEGDPIAWITADGLNGYFWIRRYIGDWLATSRIGLKAAAGAQDRRAEAAMHIVVGQARRTAGEYAGSGEHFDRARRLADEIGWPEASARALSNRAIVYAELGMLPQAAAGLQQALEADRRIGRVAGEAVGLLNLGSLRMRMGEMRSAYLDTTRARAIYRQLGSPGGEAMCIANLGLICRELGRYPEAEELLLEALALTQRINDAYGECWARLLESSLRHDGKRHPEALGSLAAAEAILQVSADRKTESVLRVFESEVRRELGDLAAARAALTTGLELVEAMEDDFGIAEAKVALARLELAADRPEAALEVALELEAESARRGYRLLRGHARDSVAHAYALLGDTVTARQWAVRALGNYRSVGCRYGEDSALALLAALPPA